MSASQSEYIIDYPLLTKLCFSSIIFIAGSVSTPSALGTARANKKPGRKYTCTLVSFFVILGYNLLRLRGSEGDLCTMRLRAVKVIDI